MDGTSEIGLSLWPAIALAIGWVYLLVFEELRRRKSGDSSPGPANRTSKTIDELRCSTLQAPAMLAKQTFDESRFLEQAAGAYEFILTRYAAGAMQELAGLLDTDVFEAFAAETARRASAGEAMTLEFVALESCEIVDTVFDEAEATIRVRFESELFLSEGGKPGDGDMPAATLLHAVDIWTFRKEYSSESPVWTLTATDTE